MEWIKKEAKEQLCVGLDAQEFCCKCSNKFCRMTIVDDNFLIAYSKFRLLLNVSLKINSGFRCQAHNFAVGGVAASYHQRGAAVDISKTSLSYLSEEEIEFAARDAGFTFVKFYENFVHLHIATK